jgi:putative ABC transport system permease protein
MIQNFFKVAIRNLIRNKAFSSINIFGLAAGLATCLLILLYVADELSYDKHHNDGDRVYRIVYTTHDGTWASQPAPVAAAMKEDFPEVEEVTRLLKLPGMDKVLIKYTEANTTKKFYEKDGYYVDPTFFKLFTYHFVHGDPQTSLDEPNSIVIGETLAAKLFGNKNPINKSLTISLPFGEANYTVKGVFNSANTKSHIPSSYFLSMRNNDVGAWVSTITDWTNTNIFHTYYKLKPNTNASAFEKKLQPFLERHAGEALTKAGFARTMSSQPLKDIYLKSSVGNEIAPNGNLKFLYILGSIAVFILVIACINFMNLSTARSEKRAREVGVRKVMGAVRTTLVAQFLGESLIISTIALAIGLGIVWALLPFFNRLTQKDLHFFHEPGYIVFVAALTVITGIFAGLYPAFYLSAFQPVHVLKGRLKNNFSAGVIRKGLVVFQFGISAILIFGAIVIWKQLDYVQNQQLGFNKEQQLVIPANQELASKYYPLKDALLKNSAVKSVTSANTYPGVKNLNNMVFYAEGKTSKEFIVTNMCVVENDYFSTLGLHFVAGRPFSSEFKGDSTSIILNETAVKQFGYNNENAVGKKLHFDWTNGQNDVTIVGIVKDFHFESLHNAIKPYGFSTNNFFANKYTYFIANLHTTQYSKTLSEIERICTSILPNTQFEFSFIDQDFQNNYEKEQRTSGIVISFTCIAILIACLGLFGLAAFAAESRTKELGIRKVLGASEAAIVMLLSKDFLKLVVIALLIAFPIGTWIMNQWLNNFAYRTPVSWWIFAVSGALAIIIAFSTVSYQSLKAAFMNPVKSMRTE